MSKVEAIRGTVVVKVWTVVTELGAVSLDPSHLKSLGCDPKSEAPRKTP